jgi:hypothetical protein
MTVIRLDRLAKPADFLFFAGAWSVIGAFPPDVARKRALA